MRELGQIDNPYCKITVFNYNQKFTVKFEVRQYEQAYKIREGERMRNMADVKRLINEDFIRTVMERFKVMNKDFAAAIEAASEAEEDDEFDEIL